MASSDAFDVTIKGTAGHGAHPHLAIDAIVGAAHFVEQVQTIVSREIAPISSAVLTIGKIQGGTARNIIASSVELQASVRTLEAETADRVQAAVRRILDGLKTGHAHRLRPRVDQAHARAAQSQADDGAGARRGAQHARRAERDRNARAQHGQRGLRVVRGAGPSAHLRIGSKIEGHETAIHRTDYRLNEDAIPLATRLMARAVRSFSTSHLLLRECVRQHLRRARDVRQLLAGVEPARLSSRLRICIWIARSAAASASAGSITTIADSSAMIDVARLHRHAAARHGHAERPAQPDALGRDRGQAAAPHRHAVVADLVRCRPRRRR